MGAVKYPESIEECKESKEQCEKDIEELVIEMNLRNFKQIDSLYEQILLLNNSKMITKIGDRVKTDYGEGKVKEISLGGWIKKTIVIGFSERIINNIPLLLA